MLKQLMTNEFEKDVERNNKVHGEFLFEFYSLLFIIILFTSTFKDITFILKTFYNMLKVLI